MSVDPSLSSIMHLFGDLRPLVEDQTISEIQVNSCDAVFYERDGVRQMFPAALDPLFLRGAVTRIAHAVGQEVIDSETGELLSPKLQCRFADGSRMSVLWPPCSVGGMSLTLRKFTCRSEGLLDLVKRGMMTEQEAHDLAAAVQDRRNIIVSGPTGAGKTTLANALVGEIDDSERILAIEEPAEMEFRQPNVVRWEARAGFRQLDLLQEALRHNPDRIVVGEFRGAEAYTLLQAMNTGHEGTISTTHANSARDTLARFALCASMAAEAPAKLETIQQMVGQNVHLVVHVRKDRRTGARRIHEVAAVRSYEKVEVRCA